MQRHEYHTYFPVRESLSLLWGRKTTSMTQKTDTKQEKDLCLERLLNWEVWRLLLGASEFNGWPLVVAPVTKRIRLSGDQTHHYTHANLWEHDIEGES